MNAEGELVGIAAVDDVTESLTEALGCSQDPPSSAPSRSTCIPESHRCYGVLHRILPAIR
jgi:hypothetical protein